MHSKICQNGCIFAERSFLLSYTSKCGDNYVDAEYIWRCKKIDRLVTYDAPIRELGCATFTTDVAGHPNAETLVKEAEDLLKKINEQIGENKQQEPVPVTGGAAIPEPVVEAANTPVLPVPEPIITEPPTSQKPTGEQPVVEKRRRGRKPKSASTPQTPVIPEQVTPEPPSNQNENNNKKEVENDGTQKDQRHDNDHGNI